MNPIHDWPIFPVIDYFLSLSKYFLLSALGFPLLTTVFGLVILCLTGWVIFQIHPRLPQNLFVGVSFCGHGHFHLALHDEKDTYFPICIYFPRSSCISPHTLEHASKDKDTSCILLFESLCISQRPFCDYLQNSPYDGKGIGFLYHTFL